MKRWEVVLEHDRDTRAFDRFWTRWGANSYKRWLERKFARTLRHFYPHGYRLIVRRIR